MLHEEGLDNVFARHDRLAEATRRAVRAWGLEIMCRDPKYYSPTITAVMLPEGHDADAFRSARARHFQHLLRRELRPIRRQIFPHRPSRRHQRRPADRRARHHRDGACARRRPAQEGRRAGGDGLSRLARTPGRRRRRSKASRSRSRCEHRVGPDLSEHRCALPPAPTPRAPPTLAAGDRAEQGWFEMPASIAAETVANILSSTAPPRLDRARPMLERRVTGNASTRISPQAAASWGQDLEELYAGRPVCQSVEHFLRKTGVTLFEDANPTDQGDRHKDIQGLGYVGIRAKSLEVDELRTKFLGDAAHRQERQEPGHTSKQRWWGEDSFRGGRTGPAAPRVCCPALDCFIETGPTRTT